MQSMFPFGFPAPTALYLTLYVITLSVHAVLIAYVLPGSAYVAAAAALGKRERDPVARKLVDWLPFGLGTAITAGVAPLLFLQILYQERFYTANLLLFHRWMAIVPALIVGFYLLYLAKAKLSQSWPRAVRTAISVGAFACFAFTAWSWTENHLIALDREAWPLLYGSGVVTHDSSEVASRLGFWLASALPIMALIVGWQLRHAHDDDRTAVTRTAVLALVGLVTSAALAMLHARALEPETRAVITGPLARPWLMAAGIGAVVQAIAWIWHLAARRWSRNGLGAASAGAVLSVLGVAVLRETKRLSHVDIEQLFAMHERAASADGMLFFLGFLVLNAGLITWCLVMTRRGLRQSLASDL